MQTFISIFKNLFLTCSLSPLRRQLIMESSDSIASHAASLPPTISENPEYLPPALPPKRHRTTNKLNNLNTTPPSSLKDIFDESIEETNELSSHTLNNNTSLMNNIKDTIVEILPKTQIVPSSPSSNYVQITTSTMNAAAAAAAVSSNSLTAQSANELLKTVPNPTSKSNSDSDMTKTSESNDNINNLHTVNDVRVIYTNVNNLNASNNQLSEENQYNQLYNDSMNDRNINNETDISNKLTAKHDSDKCRSNNRKIISNNNNTIKNENTDDEEVVVLRRPQVSPNNSIKVFNTSFIN